VTLLWVHEVLADDGYVGFGESNLGCLNCPAKVGDVDSGNRVVAASVAKLSGEAAPTIGQLPVEPTRSASQLVVLPERVRLEDQSSGHDFTVTSLMSAVEKRDYSADPSVRECPSSTKGKGRRLNQKPT
jgi:hypothetical protein